MKNKIFAIFVVFLLIGYSFAVQSQITPTSLDKSVGDLRLSGGAELVGYDVSNDNFEVKVDKEGIVETNEISFKGLAIGAKIKRLYDNYFIFITQSYSKDDIAFLSNRVSIKITSDGKNINLKEEVTTKKPTTNIFIVVTDGRGDKYYILTPEGGLMGAEDAPNLSFTFSLEGSGKLGNQLDETAKKNLQDSVNEEMRELASEETSEIAQLYEQNKEKIESHEALVENHLKEARRLMSLFYEENQNRLKKEQRMISPDGLSIVSSKGDLVPFEEFEGYERFETLVTVQENILGAYLHNLYANKIILKDVLKEDVSDLDEIIKILGKRIIDIKILRADYRFSVGAYGHAIEDYNNELSIFNKVKNNEIENEPYKNYLEENPRIIEELSEQRDISIALKKASSKEDKDFDGAIKILIELRNKYDKATQREKYIAMQEYIDQIMSMRIKYYYDIHDYNHTEYYSKVALGLVKEQPAQPMYNEEARKYIKDVLFNLRVNRELKKLNTLLKTPGGNIQEIVKKINEIYNIKYPDLPDRSLDEKTKNDLIELKTNIEKEVETQLVLQGNLRTLGWAHEKIYNRLELINGKYQESITPLKNPLRWVEDALSLSAREKIQDDTIRLYSDSLIGIDNFRFLLNSGVPKSKIKEITYGEVNCISYVKGLKFKQSKGSITDVLAADICSTIREAGKRPEVQVWLKGIKPYEYYEKVADELLIQSEYVKVSALARELYVQAAGLAEGNAKLQLLKDVNKLKGSEWRESWGDTLLFVFDPFLWVGVGGVTELAIGTIPKLAPVASRLATVYTPTFTKAARAGVTIFEAGGGTPTFSMVLSGINRFVSTVIQKFAGTRVGGIILTPIGVGLKSKLGVLGGKLGFRNTAKILEVLDTPVVEVPSIISGSKSASSMVKSVMSNRATLAAESAEVDVAISNLAERGISLKVISGTENFASAASDTLKIFPRLPRNLKEVELGNLPYFIRNDVGAFIFDEKAIYIGSVAAKTGDPEAFFATLFHEMGEAYYKELTEAEIIDLTKAYEVIKKEGAFMEGRFGKVAQRGFPTRVGVQMEDVGQFYSDFLKQSIMDREALAIHITKQPVEVRKAFEVFVGHFENKFGKEVFEGAAGVVEEGISRLNQVGLVKMQECAVYVKEMREEGYTDSWFEVMFEDEFGVTFDEAVTRGLIKPSPVSEVIFEEGVSLEWSVEALRPYVSEEGLYHGTSPEKFLEMLKDGKIIPGGMEELRSFSQGVFFDEGSNLEGVIEYGDGVVLELRSDRASKYVVKQVPYEISGKLRYATVIEGDVAITDMNVLVGTEFIPIEENFDLVAYPELRRSLAAVEALDEISLREMVKTLSPEDRAILDIFEQEGRSVGEAVEFVERLHWVEDDFSMMIFNSARDDLLKMGALETEALEKALEFKTRVSLLTPAQKSKFKSLYDTLSAPPGKPVKAIEGAFAILKD